MWPHVAFMVVGQAAYYTGTKVKTTGAATRLRMFRNGGRYEVERILSYFHHWLVGTYSFHHNVQQWPLRPNIQDCGGRMLPTTFLRDVVGSTVDSWGIYGLWPDVTDYRSRYEAGCGHLAIEFPMEKVWTGAVRRQGVPPFNVFLPWLLFYVFLFQLGWWRSVVCSMAMHTDI